MERGSLPRHRDTLRARRRSLVSAGHEKERANLKITEDLVRRAFGSPVTGDNARVATDPGHPSLQRAAVAAIFSAAAPLRILLIKRAKSANDPWSQHMALPGGKHDPKDTDLLATAIRETHEELGLDLGASAEWLGSLPAQALSIDGRRLEIRPFAFVLKGSPVLCPNREVDDVAWVTLESLADGSRDSTVEHLRRGQRLRFPAWDVEAGQVWGLTYRMIQSLLELVAQHA